MSKAPEDPRAFHERMWREYGPRRRYSLTEAANAMYPDEPCERAGGDLGCALNRGHFGNHVSKCGTWPMEAGHQLKKGTT